MTDETRPQKKSIDMSEVVDSPMGQPTGQSNIEKLQKMSQMRQNISEGEGDDDMSSQSRPPRNYQDPVEKLQESGIKVSGNMPVAFAARLNQIESEEDTYAPPTQPLPRAPKPKKNEMYNGNASSNDDVYVNSTLLQNLIAGLNTGKNLEHTVELPSRGVFYDGRNGPADGIVSLRPMTGEEEQILATGSLVKKGTAINKIIEACMSPRYNTQHFIYEDITYLLIYLRGISYSHNYDVELACHNPTCGRQFETSINLSDLPVENCPDDHGPDNLFGVLPTSGYRFNYRYMTYNDDTLVEQHKDLKARGRFDAALDDTVLFKTSLLVNDIEGLTEKTHLLALLKKLPVNDVVYLRNKIFHTPFGVDTKIKVMCNYCANEFEVLMPLGVNFFSPRPGKDSQTSQ